MDLKRRFEAFRNFAMRGNVLDLAVGVIVGGAFGKIITSLVNDIVMPLFGLLIGAVNIKTLAWVLRVKDEAKGIEELAVRYGAFLQNVLDFLIIAVSIYMFIKLFEKLRRKQEAVPVVVVEPTKSEKLLEEIRDLLKSKSND